jgi:hypothetical protein
MLSVENSHLGGVRVGAKRRGEVEGKQLQVQPVEPAQQQQGSVQQLPPTTLKNYHQ